MVGQGLPGQYQNCARNVGQGVWGAKKKVSPGFFSGQHPSPTLPTKKGGAAGLHYFPFFVGKVGDGKEHPS